jgi:hypothetical protein
LQNKSSLLTLQQVTAGALALLVQHAIVSDRIIGLKCRMDTNRFLQSRGRAN